MSPKLVVILTCLVGGIAGDLIVDDPVAHGAVPPLPPVPPPGAPGLGFGGLFPGLGGGFHKSLDIGGGAGFGPYFGGLGGGFPPGGPGIEGLDGGPGFGGGLGGLLGPSYIPSTWIGSALGAKGDLLFPIVIFVFFIVGIWTVVQFLLGLIVPLIAAKFAVLNSITHPNRRDLSSEAPDAARAQALERLTLNVMDALEHGKCLQESACHIGNLMHNIGPHKIDEYEKQIMEIKVMTPELLEIIKTVAKKGDVNCSTYACKGDQSSEASSSKGQTDHTLNEAVPTQNKEADEHKTNNGEKESASMFKW